MTRSVFFRYGICPATLDYSTVVEKSIRCVQAKKDTGLVQAGLNSGFSATCRGIMGRISLGKAVEGEKKAGCPAFSCYDYTPKIIAWKAGFSEAFSTVSHALRGLPLSSRALRLLLSQV